MKKKLLPISLITVLMLGFSLILIACSEDSENEGEALANKYCDCEKIADTEKRETCIDKVDFQVRQHPQGDVEFWNAYREALNKCQN